MYKIIPIPKQVNSDLIHELCNTGINAFRFNFSHINSKTADKALENITSSIQILQDLQGHKLRVDIISTEIFIPAYTRFTFVPNELFSSEKFNTNIVVPLSFDDFTTLNTVEKFVVEARGQYIDIKITKRQKRNNLYCFQCMAEKDFIIRTGKGIMPIGINRENMPLSNKDKNDIIWGIKNNAKVIVYSFASSQKQIIELKDYIKSVSPNSTTSIWSKIECPEGIKNIDSILDVSDGIMIGRGDLSAQYSPAEISKIQDQLIHISKEKNKPCIVATHIFDNYNQNHMPNLSDVTSMYHLSQLGASGFMLSDEFLFSKNQITLAKDFANVCDSLRI